MNKKPVEQTKNGFSISIDNALIKILFGKEKSSSEKIVEMTLHGHSHAEIFTCKSGEITLEFPQATVTLYQNDGVIIPPSMLHNRINRDKEIDTNAFGVVCSEINCQVEYDLYSFISKYINGKNIVLFRNKPEFCAIVDKILNNNNQTNKFILSISFVTEFCKLFSPEDFTIENLKVKTETNVKNIDRLVKLDFLINTKFMTGLNNKQVASELFISERQLARLVREHYGSTLHALIVNKRVEAAATLLEKTDYSVESISLLVGFKSKTAFYNDFYKIYGYTPTEYRQKM